MIRIARVGVGLTLVLMGIFLLVLPGPGVLTIAGGLAILAIDFAWARNILDSMKKALPEPLTGTEASAAPEDAADDGVS